jgi:ubiquinone/menaquinone biosynthesis C-methylase UbiE
LRARRLCVVPSGRLAQRPGRCCSRPDSSGTFSEGRRCRQPGFAWISMRRAAEQSGGGSTERYAFGYEEGVQTYLQLHTVERCAEFLRPHLAPGMSLLDAGCGPGTITVGLAEIIAPGRLVAVDVGADEVATASAALSAAGHDNAHVEVADVQELPFEDGTFDAVFSHAVIDYLVDPLVALREFRRVLRPGGVIGVRSVNNDLSVIGPYDELLDEGLALFRRAVASLGGDMCRGRLVGRMLKDTGFERIFTSPSYERAQSREEWQSVMSTFAKALDGTRIAEIVVREGWADKNRLAEIVSAFERFGTDTSNCFALAWGEAAAFKPT